MCFVTNKVRPIKYLMLEFAGPVLSLTKIKFDECMCHDIMLAV